jgi:hypothetical protein
MNTGKIPKQILRLQPREKRSIGRPVKRKRKNMRPGIILDRKEEENNFLQL